MSAPVTPLVLVFKELLEGDLLKIQAESNIATTGGGARDLRFPAKQFDATMHRIFTKDGFGKGSRPIRIATVTYGKSPSRTTTQLEYWPPTPSRPAEGRVARIHDSPALAGVPDSDKGRVFFMLIRASNNETWLRYAYEDHLRGGEWSQLVSSTILSCAAEIDQVNAARAQKLPAQGYIDFLVGDSYCHVR